MDALNIIKLMIRIFIWTTFITGSFAGEALGYDPINHHKGETAAPHSGALKTQKDQSFKTNPTTFTPSKPPSTNTTQSTGRNSTDPDVENIPTNSSVNVQAAQLKSSHILRVETEETTTRSSIWIYITVGVLCVAALNASFFWYRKRAAAYSFVPASAATTKARR